MKPTNLNQNMMTRPSAETSLEIERATTNFEVRDEVRNEGTTEVH